MSSHSLGANFNKEELENIQKGLTVYTENNQYYTNDGTTYYDTSSGIAVNEWGTSLLEIENTSTAEIQAIADDGGYTFEQAQQIVTGEGVTIDENFNTDKKNEETSTTNQIPYRDPLRKIGGGRVLQYPIDLDTDLQDHFEIQVFKYRPAGSLPAITSTNQGSNAAGTKQLRGGYYSGSNRRGNRQNFRLQDLQSTIQLPMPPSIKDTNTVSFNDSRMSGFSAAIMGPAVAAFLGKNNKFTFPEAEKIQSGRFKGLPTLKGIRTLGSNLLTGTGEALLNILGAGAEAVRNDEFTRLQSLNAIAQAVSALGVSIDVDQAITRTSGAVRNPNLELLFNGPSLRNFSFTIRLTPRSPEESKRVRMIIRVLKQHSAVKRNAGVFNDSANSNFLIGTPDVFKLRYIKARTQKDIKGLNKFKTCALTSVSVDYTGEVGRFAAYEEDSQPVTTIISLSFTELTPIYDEDYAEFTSDDDVGL